MCLPKYSRIVNFKLALQYVFNQPLISSSRDRFCSSEAWKSELIIERGASSKKKTRAFNALSFAVIPCGEI
jgi:hypothetical protein